ncbi:ABC transporter ATP-binding protein [Endomicrobium proavitum]|uniref:Aliphatic sulfonates import ATP-binding protein SsuB n=1 Tax=Endomicrobium proavitum TaxID=1408281 RepID=A0A0G3WIE2_9BACT|nr:ABC transporter ATP-binding protein [Endomicrobium proavitum]AKL98063.1 Aliphatic sulfonates import ATP-binding protein SsuB [Endomicrobium proavitum]
MSAQTLINIKNVNRIYTDTKGNKVYALKNVSLEIRQGEFISFIGPSGCGKTTLLRLIAGLDQPQSGALYVQGERIEKTSHERGYIFQQPTLFPWKTVEENVAIGLKARGVYQEKKNEIAQYIKLIGLNGFEKSYPHEISGGMAQRVAIIRALINEPKILLLDEPLAALDAFKRMELQQMLTEVWSKTKTTMALVTHDVDEAISLSQRIAIMTARPGEISKVIDVNLGQERNRNDDDFITLRKEILKELHLVTVKPEPEYRI